MRKTWLGMLICGMIGVSAAWMVNHSRYEGDIRFGPFTPDGRLQADQAAAHLESLAPSAGTPQLVVVDDDTVHDFGIMSPGTEGEKSFQIENRGTADLELRLGASTCKCTISALERELVPPGESTNVRLNWTVKPGEAEFKQSAQILTNDPAQPALTLAIVGQVVDQFAVVPDAWSFGEVSATEPFELAGTIYSFVDAEITLLDPKFSNSRMTELADFNIESYQPSEDRDGVNASARQAFQVTAKIAAGLRQGTMSPQLLIPIEGSSEQQQLTIPINGTVVGPISMILNERLRDLNGTYVYDFGKIGENDPLTATAFVVLKGNEYNNVSLRVGETSPDGVVKAKLGDPRGSGSMRLFPLEMELIPGPQSIERRGISKDDYGTISIESDNPKVSKLRVALKFSLDAR